MTTEIQQTTAAIKSQLSMIQQNRKQRNQIYQGCMQNYIKNLKKQIQQLESTQQINVSRNKNISQMFQNVYDKVLTSANMTIRKIKQTSFEKKVFWEDVIKNNAALNDIELKKEFYTQKRDAEDRYYAAIEQQKTKKIPYAVILGKNKRKQGLRDWKQSNKTFEQKVTKGTATLNQWRNNWQRTNQNTYERQNYRPNNEAFDQIARKDFMRSGQNKLSIPNNKNFINQPRNFEPFYNESNSSINFLKNFDKKQ